MKKYFWIYVCLFGAKVQAQQATLPTAKFNQLAREYVKLGLAIGQYDKDFVDAYYGPDSLQPKQTKAAVFPKSAFIAEVKKLKKEIATFLRDGQDDELKGRAYWILAQLTAFDQRIKIFSGTFSSFDKETKALFGVVVPKYSASDYQRWIDELSELLPGDGDVATRFQKLASKFTIPPSKIDTVFKTALSLSRTLTKNELPLPPDESFVLEYVTGKPWSGYNWYKGNYQSVIQLNTDMPILVERAIDVASHESYPGHHVYNMMLEQQLYRQKGWVEISLYPLFSPQSLIAEGSANYGIELAFPGVDKIDFAKNVLLPLAGVDTTGVSIYFQALEVKGKLNFVRNDVARGLINKTMKEPEAIKWLVTYGLNTEESAKKSIEFIRKYRSYVINYNYGMALVKQYVEKRLGNDASPKHRWQIFSTLLSTQVTSSDLLQ